MELDYDLYGKVRDGGEAGLYGGGGEAGLYGGGGEAGLSPASLSSASSSGTSSFS